ncbi:FAD dependent oxidoreductase [Cordyceps fumosorosea ARSEF 2679]|uniref:FAD dependent oxidoreductase n=1 Tax=Cordyceps fumosorosea (strain ARSEF 2679) TaxID=1081104 RepID=A0A167QKV6_CORFA|nr:FAD dependent oxidoreductase [Cordyceps fumosorosea ARSEF 2679]OAA57731.1 FAD dependent oxidoreductase [Cordyceps fumosorosea ARSEF 2679]
MDKPVLIIGAGVVGLSLAHGLKKHGIPFEIYERDEHIDARPHGWAITLHWALPFLEELLDPDTMRGLNGVQVDPSVGRNDTGNFVFLNLETLEPKFHIPPNRRRRVNREKLRKLLLQGVAEHVRWGKRLDAIDVAASDNGGVRASFSDGTSADGSILVGIEGSGSRTRKFLLPDAYRNYQLPARLLGATLTLSAADAEPLLRIDPLLFQGCHPTTGNYLWISLLDSPEINGTLGGGPDRETYSFQVIQSRLARTPADELVPAADAERVAIMKRRAAEFHPTLRDVVHRLPEDAEVMEILLQDWPCQPWDSHGGRVTLAGDAAHAMTMYRGEAANHGLLDARNLCRALAEVAAGTASLKAAIDGYEAEMVERTNPAALLSRQACLDAHDFHCLNENSPVLKRRAIKQ